MCKKDKNNKKQKKDQKKQPKGNQGKLVWFFKTNVETKENNEEEIEVEELVPLYSKSDSIIITVGESEGEED